MKTLFVLLDKEIRQFFRNAFLPKLVIVFPVMVILIIPWVTTIDVRHIGVSVVDNDHSETSRRIILKIEASDYFNLRGVTESYDDSFALLEGGEADVILTIPNDFELSLIGDSPKRIGIDVNGINAMKGGLGSQYMVQLVMQTFGELQQEKSVVVSPDLFTVQNRYNPTLDYKHFMIPALMKPMIITVVAPLLWITAVISAPTRTPTKRLFVRIPSSFRICSPAHFCTPPDMLCTPNRNIPRPPANINRFSKSLIVILDLSIPDRRLPDQGSEIPT